MGITQRIASEVKPGDRIRYANTEFVVARIEAPFLGRENMIAFIEDEPERWHKYPATSDADVQLILED
jgi:hypothetical protein